MHQLLGGSPPSGAPPPLPEDDVATEDENDDTATFDDEDNDDDDDDYDPDATSEEETESSDDDLDSLDSEAIDEDDANSNLIPFVNMIPHGNGQFMLILPSMPFTPSSTQSMVQPPPPPPPPRDPSESLDIPTRKRPRTEELEFIRYFTPEEKAYWRNLDEERKTEIMELQKSLKDKDLLGAMPMRFKFLTADIDSASKTLILAKLDQFQMMHEGSGEYFKLRNWLQSAARIPFGKYFPLPVTPSDPAPKIAGFLQDVHRTLDRKVYGHMETKNQILRILAQWIANPNSKGHVIGIQGFPGTGKTSLVKDGVCKALGLPFGFVALGGAADGSFLEGHSFTYEGSTYGKIAEILMKTQCMNPVLFFDELDKVSGTRRGDEVIGILTHLTDSTQNERFQDRYFGEIELNLSKSLIVFSYNDESLINPILKDRMITIRVKGYTTQDKLCIARDYLIPDILEQYKMTKEDVVFPTDVVEYIITKVNDEEGVRNLKRGIESIVSWINMHRYIPPEDGKKIEFPITITEEHVRQYLRPEDDSKKISKDILNMMYI